MKPTTLKTLGILAVLLLAAVVMPVSAQQMVISSDVSPSLTFTVGETDVSFPLTTVGLNSMQTANSVSATSNGGYTIKARDFNSNGAHPGHMVQMVLPSTILSGYLTNPFEVSADGTAYVALSGVDQTLYTGTPGTFSHAVGIRQTTTINDPVLPAGQKYVIAVVITGAATP